MNICEIEGEHKMNIRKGCRSVPSATDASISPSARNESLDTRQQALLIFYPSLACWGGM